MGESSPTRSVDSLATRPYRSHKIPACARCRQRKARCTQDASSQACLLCRLDGAACERQEVTPGAETSKKRRNRESSTPNARKRITGVKRKLTNSSDQDPDSLAHVIGPVAAHDAQILDQHLERPQDRRDRIGEANEETDGKNLRPYNAYSNDPKKPVMYMKVPRRRAGYPRHGLGSSFNHAETLEKLLEPALGEIGSTFVSQFNTCFPILRHDHAEKLRQSSSHREIPDALRCEIYAVSLVFWPCSKELSKIRRPDKQFAWNLAVASLHDDFLEPSLETITAALLDLSGRPIFSMTGNALNLGRVVALSHTLGLNRDPTSWNLNVKEKNRRITLWWALIIHDRWSSISHGTPPLIQKGNYDVPLPSKEGIMESGAVSEAEENGVNSFIQLCGLTEILGDLLPLAFDLRTAENLEATQLGSLGLIQSQLGVWHNSITYFYPPDCVAPGLCNLRLSYLAAKLFLFRVELHVLGQSNNDVIKHNVRKLCLQRCYWTAMDFVKQVKTLTPEDIRGFWLPYTAYHFSSVIVMLLRLGLEDDFPYRDECLNHAKFTISWLNTQKTHRSWDLAEVCLHQCEYAVDKICKGRATGYRGNDDSDKFSSFGQVPEAPEELLFDDIPQFDFDMHGQLFQDGYDMFPLQFDF